MPTALRRPADTLATPPARAWRDRLPARAHATRAGHPDPDELAASAARTLDVAVADDSGSHRPADAVVATLPRGDHAALRRAGRHDLADACRGHRDLAWRHLDDALDHADAVAAIVPATLLTSGPDRLVAAATAVVLIPADADPHSDQPRGLVLADHTATGDPDVWDGPHHLGRLSQLRAALPSYGTDPGVAFNHPHGAVAVWAIDDAHGPSLGFGPGDAVPSDEVTRSSRHRTRAHVPTDADPGDLAEAATRLLAAYREGTADALLTPFIGRRADGKWRRRLDYATARRLLTAANADLDADPAPQLPLTPR